jgi:uncharacterized membrane protein required for colicin V production
MPAILDWPLIDLVLLVALFGFFILGVIQGTIRTILGIISILFAFLLAANLRGPLGDGLASNWNQFPVGYNRMLAFLILFVVFSVGFLVLILGYYKRTELAAGNPVLEDLAGGSLGLLMGLILLAIVVAIMGSYQIPGPFKGELDYLRDFHDTLLFKSNLGAAFRDSVVPVIVHGISPLLPSDLVTAFP